jgi:uncharacterized Fe-S center protein
VSSIVYFASARAPKWDYKYSLIGKLEELVKCLDFSQHIAADEYVAVKTHFGSQGVHRIVRPIFLRKIVEGVKAVGGKPFVTDTTRIMGWDYLEVANQEGINPMSVGAPVLLADGLFGCDNVSVQAGPILGQVSVASAIYDAPAMVVVTHFKGHIQSGFGGAIKNIAMGGVSGQHRSGDWKQARGHLHATGEMDMVRNLELCTLCLQCYHVCPTGAVLFDGEDISFDEDNCWRCGRCARVCPEGAIEPGKVLYFSFVLEVQPECDCMPAADTPVVQDQGILASTDIVAIEQAAYDLVNKAVPLPQSLAADKELRQGDRILAEALGVDGQEHIDAAAELGLGSKEYELVEVKEKIG